MKYAHALMLLLLGAAIAPAAAAAEAGGGCLVALEGSADLGELPKGVRAIAPASSEGRARVLFACLEGRVSGLTIRLVPGQFAEASLVLVGFPEQAATLTAENGLPADWSRVESRSLNAETTLITLSISAPDSAQSGKAFSERLRLASSPSDLDIPVMLEILDRRPLFRDKFDDIDPVIGQFSMVH